MKKFLLCMVLAGLMIPVVAQQKLALEKRDVQVQRLDKGAPTQSMLPIIPNESLVLFWKVAGKSEGYDRQTQGGVYPMTKVHDDDAFIACTWTNEDNPPFGSGNTQNRGIGYAYSMDKGETWSPQETRLGGIPVYWPSYAQWGKNGEAFMARSYDSYNYEHNGETIPIKDGVVLFTRETRGEGEWTITPVPYPEGIQPTMTRFMAWGQMATSGEDNQYIHIICPMNEGDYNGYKTPLLYYRTQDGKTWEEECVVVPEMVGQDWGSQSYYADALSFAVQGNTIACSFINWGSHGHVIRSHDNGKTWSSIKFFDSPVLGELTPADYADTCYIPTHGCLTLDKNGKMHIAFSVLLSANAEAAGYMSLWGFLGSSFLSYWNEDMPPIDGDVSYVYNKMGYIVDDYFDWDQSSPDENMYYVISTVPKWPIIGFCIPTLDDHIYTIDENIVYNWATSQSYGVSGCYIFPQMEVSEDNVLHLAYLGLLDGGVDGSYWRRHPYYTTRNEDGIWTKTEYLVNNIDVIDKEFAYLTSAGIGTDRWYLMAQVDPSPGVNVAYSGGSIDHDPTTNSYYFFPLGGMESIENIDYTPLTMSVFPNPASGQATVKIDGRKGNVTVYNMLGQTVYHVENVENLTTIPLTNMATGVYFVTVRSGNATATQKLIVK